MRIKQLSLEQEGAQFRARTARLTKWKELVVVAQQELELPPEAPQKLKNHGFI